MELIFIQIFIIFMLFLRELGIPRMIYEEIVTNPLFTMLLKIFGDTLYMIGGSIVGAVIYAYFVETKIYIFALTTGVLFIMVGAYLKRE